VQFIYSYLFFFMWLGYFVYWWAMSKDVKATERSEPDSSRLARLVLVVGAVALLWLPSTPVPLINHRFLPLSPACFWIGAAITAIGLLFSVWARRHLGSNWSQAVTLKKDHELITSGPYALLRHPIYTGLLLGIVGCAVARGEWRGLLAVALVFVTLWQKLKLEEKWMRAQFGESYEAYCQRVPALVPFLIGL
jgi:protein-S-isoprenylcysteine O-methyltransferase Ste14